MSHQLQGRWRNLALLWILPNYRTEWSLSSSNPKHSSASLNNSMKCNAYRTIFVKFPVGLSAVWAAWRSLFFFRLIQVMVRRPSLCNYQCRREPECGLCWMGIGWLGEPVWNRLKHVLVCPVSLRLAASSSFRVFLSLFSLSFKLGVMLSCPSFSRVEGKLGTRSLISSFKRS